LSSTTTSETSNFPYLCLSVFPKIILDNSQIAFVLFVLNKRLPMQCITNPGLNGRKFHLVASASQNFVGVDIHYLNIFLTHLQGNINISLAIFYNFGCFSNLNREGAKCVPAFDHRFI
jgi:hypothetical protein